VNTLLTCSAHSRHQLPYHAGLFEGFSAPRCLLLSLPAEALHKGFPVHL